MSWPSTSISMVLSSGSSVEGGEGGEHPPPVDGLKARQRRDGGNEGALVVLGRREVVCEVNAAGPAEEPHDGPQRPQASEALGRVEAVRERAPAVGYGDDLYGTSFLSAVARFGPALIGA